MFEIYREQYNGRYQVVYFTELNDHTRETEISKALSGEHLYDGFIKEFRKDQAKTIIERFLQRLNDGELVEVDELERELADFTPRMVRER